MQQVEAYLNKGLLSTGQAKILVVNFTIYSLHSASSEGVKVLFLKYNFSSSRKCAGKLRHGLADLLDISSKHCLLCLLCYCPLLEIQFHVPFTPAHKKTQTKPLRKTVLTLSPRTPWAQKSCLCAQAQEGVSRENLWGRGRLTMAPAAPVQTLTKRPSCSLEHNVACGLQNAGLHNGKVTKELAVVRAGYILAIKQDQTLVGLEISCFICINATPQKSTVN